MDERASERVHAWEDEGVSEQLRERVFDAYVCRSIDRGLPHPSEVYEPSTLADVHLPKTDYPLWDAIPQELLDEGKLSQLQIEGILHACSRHAERLVDGRRAGFLIGDGAGVGKGRQVAGIVLDNYVRGRTRHLWLSTSSDLYLDAKRDMEDLGLHIKVINGCRELDREWRATGLSAEYKEGIMFCTYSTLVSESGRKARLHQIMEWLGGADFDGCIIFDECHKAKNFLVGNDGEGTKVAKTVVEVQENLPNARVVYCSATSVSEIAHMGYLSRLALWGPGTAFRDFSSFREAMKSRGLGFLEMLSIELKSQGKYVVRGLSYTGAEFLEVECPLTSEQEEMWDAAVHLWHELRTSIALALDITATRGVDIWKNFWATQQRFFRLLCVSLKVPTVLKEVREGLQTGHAVVIGLQTTGESSADALKLRAGDECGFISTAKEMLLRFIKTHFPTNMSADALEVQELDYQGEQSNECLQMQRHLLSSAKALNLPVNFLDDLIDQLGGKDCVAEMTGRKGRVVRKNGRIRYELRAEEGRGLEVANVVEKAHFMSGRKLIAIISDAASTGISLHADCNATNKRRRLHLTVELPWSADKAIQQLGRSHRSNQASAPVYKLVTSAVGGEKRFVASVASRLQSLGALTKGDRRAASGLSMQESYLDSRLGKQALRLLIYNIEQCSEVLPSGVTLDGLKSGSGDKLISAQALHYWLKPALSSLSLSSETSDVKRFLNRILGLPIKEQNFLFNYFYLLLDEQVRVAKRSGKYNEGVSDLSGSHIRRCGAQTKLWKLTYRNDVVVDRGISFECAKEKLSASDESLSSGFYQSRRPLYGRASILLAVQKMGMQNLFTIYRPNTGVSYFEMSHDDLASKYKKISAEQAATGWEEAFQLAINQCLHGPRCVNGPDCSFGRRLTRLSLITGAVCAVWGALEAILSRHEHRLNKADRSLRVVRAELDDGETLIGIRYPSHLLKEVQELLEAEEAGKTSFESMHLSKPRHLSSILAVPNHASEAPAMVLPKLKAKAFRPPKTILSYFQPSSTRGGNESGQKQDGLRQKRACPTSENAGASKKSCSQINPAMIHVIDD